MGRGGPKAQGGGKPSQSWGYWPGTWRSPRSRGREWENWQQEPEVPAFPSYDGKPRAIALKRDSQADTARKLPSAAETEEDPGGMLTTELQDFVNLARKAEQRVRSLTAARKQKDTLWAKWQEEMKQAYLKETMRHEKAVETLERDLQHALAAREDARQNIREYVQRGASRGRPLDGLPPGPGDSVQRSTDAGKAGHFTECMYVCRSRKSKFCHVCYNLNFVSQGCRQQSFKR